MPFQDRDRARRRGAALVLVLIFGVGALMLVTTMLTLSQSSVKQESEQHRLKSLHAVLKAGIAASINEINRERTDPAYDDAEDNGPGAVTGVDEDGDGKPDGVPVRGVDPDGAGPREGELLGYYRAVVDRDSVLHEGRDVLVVAAAWPSFERPAGWTETEFAARRRLVAAEVDIASQRLPFGANAMSVLGEFDKAKKFFKLDKNADVAISAPAADVPAVNIQDEELYERFLDLLADDPKKEKDPDSLVVEGGDKDNMGTLVQGEATVTNAEPGVISEQTLDQIRDGITTFVAGALLNPDTQVLATKNLKVGGETTYEGTVYLPGKMTFEAGTTVKGSGTLIIGDELVLKKGSSLEWDGDIIVVDDSKAKLKVEKGSDFTLENGVLAVISDDAEAKLEFKKGGEEGGTITLGTAEEPVAVLILSGGSEDKAKLRLKKDLEFDLYGVLAIMASKKIDVKFDKATDVNITGSLVMVMADDGGKKSEIKFEAKGGGKKDEGTVNMTFDRGVFDGALARLGAFFDPNQQILPVEVTTYWERAAPEVVATQDKVLGTPGNWGME